MSIATRQVKVETLHPKEILCCDGGCGFEVANSEHARRDFVEVVEHAAHPFVRHFCPRCWKRAVLPAAERAA